MASITWDVQPRQLAARIESRVYNTVDELEALVKGIVDDGADDMRRFILQAVTATGQRRVSTGRGQYAGRYETGTMYDAVSSKVNVDGSALRLEVEGEFGWLDEVLAYFIAQEGGTDRIPPMRALHRAWINASQEFQKEVQKVLRDNFR